MEREKREGFDESNLSLWQKTNLIASSHDKVPKAFDHPHDTCLFKSWFYSQINL